MAKFRGSCSIICGQTCRKVASLKIRGAGAGGTVAAAAPLEVRLAGKTDLADGIDRVSALAGRLSANFGRGVVGDPEALLMDGLSLPADAKD